MFLRSFFSACAAVVLCAATFQTAEAYPVTARGGTTTVTGVYNPLDLNLTLVDGTNALSYNSGTGAFSFNATFSGTYDGAGAGYAAPVSGQAGNWQLLFGTAGYPSVTASNSGGDTITLNKSVASGVVGTLTFLGTGTFNYTGLPLADTPMVGDYFNIYAAAGDFLQVTCKDGIATCNAFDVTLLQSLTQLGPYIGLNVIDTSRVNVACGTAPNYSSCGGVQLSASAPEPASLALVGLALAGMALVRRRQRRS